MCVSTLVWARDYGDRPCFCMKWLCMDTLKANEPRNCQWNALCTLVGSCYCLFVNYHKKESLTRRLLSLYFGSFTNVFVSLLAWVVLVWRRRDFRTKTDLHLWASWTDSRWGTWKSGLIWILPPTFPTIHRPIDRCCLQWNKNITEESDLGANSPIVSLPFLPPNSLQL